MAERKSLSDKMRQMVALATPRLGRTPRDDQGRDVFGKSLVELHAVPERCQKDVPLVLLHCIQHIRDHVSSGEMHEGLFRVPGNHEEVTRLRDLYNKADNPSEECLQGVDIHTVGSLLKLFLRELPEPLVPFACYEKFLEVTDKEEEGTALAVGDLILTTPVPHRASLKLLLALLHFVGGKADQNLMSFHNLAVVFGPTVLRRGGDDAMVAMQDSPRVVRCMETMIEHQPSLFPPTLVGAMVRRASIVFANFKIDDFRAPQG